MLIIPDAKYFSLKSDTYDISVARDVGDHQYGITLRNFPVAGA
jgi:hypothetical protein